MAARWLLLLLLSLSLLLWQGESKKKKRKQKKVPEDSGQRRSEENEAQLRAQIAAATKIFKDAGVEEVVTAGSLQGLGVNDSANSSQKSKEVNANRGPSDVQLLECSVCKMTMQKFKDQVARKIKGRMSREKKIKIYNDHFDKVCDWKSWPEEMVTARHHGNDHESETRIRDYRYGSKNSGGKIFKTGPLVKHEFMGGCEAFVNSRRELFLDLVLSRDDYVKASDINFLRLVCLKPNVTCEEQDVGDIDKEDEEDEPDEVGRTTRSKRRKKGTTRSEL